MKLKNEYEFVKSVFTNNLDKINNYAPKLKDSCNYQNFEKRLTFDCLYAFIGTNIICDWYTKYNCNDSHVLTLGKTVLKDLKVI
jgi:hypothetical protein